MRLIWNVYFRSTSATAGDVNIRETISLSELLPIFRPNLRGDKCRSNLRRERKNKQKTRYLKVRGNAMTIAMQSNQKKKKRIDIVQCAAVFSFLSASFNGNEKEHAPLVSRREARAKDE